MGKDPSTDQLPEDGASQARFMFDNLRELLRLGGATLDDVVRMTVYVKDNGQREAVNEQWLRCFPDPDDRPARHTQVMDLPGRMLVQLEAIAVMTRPEMTVSHVAATRLTQPDGVPRAGTRRLQGGTGLAGGSDDITPVDLSRRFSQLSMPELGSARGRGRNLRKD